MNMLAVLNFGDVVIWQLVPLHNRYTTHFGKYILQIYIIKIIDSSAYKKQALYPECI